MHNENIKPKKAGEESQDVAEELGDVILVVLWLANSMNVDLDEAMKRVFEKVEMRDRGRYEGTRYG